MNYEHKKLPPEDIFFCVNTRLYLTDKKRSDSTASHRAEKQEQRSESEPLWLCQCAGQEGY